MGKNHLNSSYEVEGVTRDEMNLIKVYSYNRLHLY